MAALTTHVSLLPWGPRRASLSERADVEIQSGSSSLAGCCFSSSCKQDGRLVIPIPASRTVVLSRCILASLPGEEHCSDWRNLFSEFHVQHFTGGLAGFPVPTAAGGGGTSPSTAGFVLAVDE
ncbi:hypothetical protein XANCAGTX0491_003438 [Xanthoria calcicola]